MSDEEIKTNFSVKFKRLYNAGKKLGVKFEAAPFKKGVEILKSTDRTGIIQNHMFYSKMQS